MKVLVTGGSGMICYGIQQIQNTYNHEFIFMSSKDCDLLNYDTTYNYFKKINPDYVINLAAYVDGLFKNICFKVDMLENNLIVNYNVLKVSYLNFVSFLLKYLLLTL